MSSIQGYTRPLSAELTVKNIGRLRTGLQSDPAPTSAVVAYSAAATNEKYLNMYDGTQVVAGGYAKLFAGIGVGVLNTDTGDGLSGEFHFRWKGWLQLNTGDTPAVNDLIYWDDTNKELTTTSSGNTKAGFAAPGFAAPYQVITTATLGSLPAGTWVHVQLIPFA